MAELQQKTPARRGFWLLMLSSFRDNVALQPPILYSGFFISFAIWAMFLLTSIL